MIALAWESNENITGFNHSAQKSNVWLKLIFVAFSPRCFAMGGVFRTSTPSTRNFTLLLSLLSMSKWLWLLPFNNLNLALHLCTWCWIFQFSETLQTSVNSAWSNKNRKPKIAAKFSTKFYLEDNWVTFFTEEL